ncbi:MAG: hypothetical protein WCI72_02055 [archaeon]
MDPVKEAFQKIKDEISLLKEEILNLNRELSLLKAQQSISPYPTNISSDTAYPTGIPAESPTVPQEIGGSKIVKTNSSTGNRGVPTDNSTYRPTDRQTDILGSLSSEISSKLNLEDVQETLNTLDNFKKELRLKFKRLTPQEMLIFTSIYSLETKGVEEITYKTIANNLNLSESSIRDYIIKLVAKGIPIVKRRVNNKQIALQISPNLQKIASLSTIIKLREL